MDSGVVMDILRLEARRSYAHHLPSQKGEWQLVH
jgi:hypothetical protein